MTHQVEPHTVFPAFDATVFTFDEFAATVGDLVRIGALVGDWEDFTVGCALHSEEPDDPDEAEAAAWSEQFRRDRHLEAATDLETWLSRRGLELSDFRRYARRHNGSTGRARQAMPPVQWWPEAVFSGAVRRWVDCLVTWLATPGEPVHHAEVADTVTVLSRLRPPGFDIDADRLRHLAGLRQRHLEWLESLRQAAVLSEQISTHRIEWTRLDYAEITLPSASAGRELAMCVNEDGLTLIEAAGQAGQRPARYSALQCELTPRTASVLGPLRRGQASPPSASATGFTVAVVLDRHPPSIEDPAIRDLALRTEAAQRLDVLCAGRVSEGWSW